MSPTDKPVRQSSFELLRIISMLMIVVHHFIVHPLNGESGLANSSIGGIINQLSSVGVNLFILISGYFKIHTSWKGFLRLYGYVVFYCLLVYGFHLWHSHESIAFPVMKTIFLHPFSNGGWWFMLCYLGLFLCAPLLNIAIEHIPTKRDFLLILCLITIVNVYLGNSRQSLYFGYDGYGFLQMIYMYLIGGYIRLYVSPLWVKKHRYALFGAYFAFCLLWLGFDKLQTALSYSIFIPGYNNPFVICASICLFLFVSSFHFHSKLVNSIAVSILAAYLIQDSYYFGQLWLYPYVGHCYENALLGEQLLYMGLFSICLLAGSVLIDQIRILLARLLFYILHKPNKTTETVSLSKK